MISRPQRPMRNRDGGTAHKQAGVLSASFVAAGVALSLCATPAQSVPHDGTTWQQLATQMSSTDKVIGKPYPVNGRKAEFQIREASHYKTRDIMSNEKAAIEAARANPANNNSGNNNPGNNNGSVGGGNGSQRKLDGKPAEIDGGRKLLKTRAPLLFAPGSAALSPEMKADIKQAVMSLPAYKSITVYAYTDHKGSEKGNDQLARERAEAVVAFIETFRPGVAGRKIPMEPHTGDNYAPDADISPEDRAKFQRRVDLRTL